MKAVLSKTGYYFWKVTQWIEQHYLWLLFCIVAKSSLSVSRYLSVDITGILKKNIPDYKITMVTVNPFKYTETLRYVIACCVLASLFLLWTELLRRNRRQKKERARDRKYVLWSCISLLLLISGDLVLQKYNSHVYGTVFWTIVAFITAITVMSVLLHFKNTAKDAVTDASD